MSSRRTLKAASAIKEVVSLAILTELRDPRIENVTVTFVEISGDMRYAKVHVSIMGDEKQQKLCVHALGRAAGYLQRRVNDRIDTRYTPRLQFVLDEGIKHALKVAEILKDVLPESDEDADSIANETKTPDETKTPNETKTPDDTTDPDETTTVDLPGRSSSEGPAILDVDPEADDSIS